MKKKIALGISLLLFLVLFGWMSYWQNHQVMDMPVMSEKRIEKIIKERIPFEESADVSLQIHGVTAPYEKTENRYYISRNSAEKHWKGTLDAVAEGVSVSFAWKEDPAFSDVAAAIADGHVFEGLIYNDFGYKRVAVLFTGLPVMTIDGHMGEQGTIVSVFDPILNVGDGYQVDTSLAYYNIRGNASKRFEKIGYRVEFFYDDGREGNDISLLGMRSDNDWHLKALYSDRSKLRDKLSIEMWNQIAAMTSTQADDGCKMEYLELIINGEYRGLYGLVEPTDYKSLGLDKTKDLIYKAALDEWPNDDLFEESEATQSFSCAGINIRQADKVYYPGIWDPFRTFWNHSYEMTSEADLETLYSVIDRQNFIDYGLYHNLIAGMDNRFKNIIYSTVFHTDGTYTIRRIPWDQNYSFGDNHLGAGEDKDIKNIRYDEELATRWLNEEVFGNLLTYDEQLPKDMYETWKSWRASFLIEDAWKAYAREQMTYLIDSGAFERDSVRWPDSENVPDTKEIENYIDARFVWLDKYLYNLPHQ